MPDILHRVGIKASPEKVFEALSTIDRIRHWWIVDTAGETKKGGIIDFGFSQMKVVKYEPEKLVQWKCVDGPKEWLGTEVSFRLKWKDEQTFVIFKHAKWEKPT